MFTTEERETLSKELITGKTSYTLPRRHKLIDLVCACKLHPDNIALVDKMFNALLRATVFKGFDKDNKLPTLSTPYYINKMEPLNEDT